MDAPRLLDLFCGAGGAGMGYHLAGFDVTGVDIRPMPRYPFRFIQADALEYVAAHGHEYDAIHASPPCQAYSEATPVEYRANHPDLIAATRKALRATGLPYVIENVEGAVGELVNPVKLCGSMFGLRIWRHRYFETSPFWMMSPMACRHDFAPILVTGQPNRGMKWVPGPRYPVPVGIRPRAATVSEQRAAMGIDWMVKAELTEAIPPAYTHLIGGFLLAALGLREHAA